METKNIWMLNYQVLNNLNDNQGRRNKWFQKIKIPEDMGLVCFDELTQFTELESFFTVMKQPAFTMGDMAANTLIKKIEGGYENNSQKIVLNPHLIVRDSA